MRFVDDCICNNKSGVYSFLVSVENNYCGIVFNTDHCVGLSTLFKEPTKEICMTS